MVQHRLGVGRGAHLLAELREHAADPALGERRGGVEGGPEVFAGEKAADGAATAAGQASRTRRTRRFFTGRAPLWIGTPRR